MVHPEDQAYKLSYPIYNCLFRLTVTAIKDTGSIQKLYSLFEKKKEF